MSEISANREGLDDTEETNSKIVQGKLDTQFGVKFGENEKQLLLSLNANPGMTAQDLAYNLGITKRAIEKQIKKLRELNIITRQGNAKNGLWVINRDATE